MKYPDEEYQFDICLSYASENSATVQCFKEKLRAALPFLKVYDYEENKHLTMGENTLSILKKIYSPDTALMILFVSEAYVKEKMFTRYEIDIASDKYSSFTSSILVIRLEENVEISWLPNMHNYFELLGEEQTDEKAISNIVNIIAKGYRLQKNDTVASLYSKILSYLQSINLIAEENSRSVLIGNKDLKLKLTFQSDTIRLYKPETQGEWNPIPIIYVYMGDKDYKLIKPYPHTGPAIVSTCWQQEAYKAVCDIIQETVEEL